ncbi:hypothetical protein [Xanthomonas cucurbitae]|uniref:Uncharacterized protein n=1 Tax=Xanthomonas cucurbitae TaxID=56453 RepID=A0ABY7Y9I6_9XANT|nr:hypothetical protein [Xanthomonas cucurbitae]WDM66646.1 hypothetical protein K6981_14030 [Xanthomonas cucurbitae]WDM70523.1 hypothetical protein K6978_14000 [Xanthomonas cucurbitae]
MPMRSACAACQVSVVGVRIDGAQKKQRKRSGFFSVRLRAHAGGVTLPGGARGADHPSLHGIAMAVRKKNAKEC